MPKICNERIKYRHKDVSKHIDVSLMYNKQYFFYIMLPVEFKKTIDVLGYDACRELGLEPFGKGKMRQIDGWIISAREAALCVQKTKEILTALSEMTAVERNVIILLYNGNNRTMYNNHLYNREHPMVGLQIGLTYAIETTIGESKEYVMVTESGKREALGLWGGGSTIIDDTEENRKFLERIYVAVNDLNEKMKSFTETEETLLTLISSGQKLLS